MEKKMQTAPVPGAIVKTTNAWNAPRPSTAIPTMPPIKHVRTIAVLLSINYATAIPLDLGIIGVTMEMVCAYPITVDPKVIAASNVGMKVKSALPAQVTLTKGIKGYV